MPYEDVLVSVERLRQRGADITVRTLPGFDHVSSWIQSLPRAVRWFHALERDGGHADIENAFEQ